ncbi:MAG: 5-formyltetrahydrofolate cyclo-ligase [Kiritimatiellae bacterium]|nr:5-formyltetrahydrofolate cyclo-ligase [Kiritimatiellia bacterium]
MKEALRKQVKRWRVPTELSEAIQQRLLAEDWWVAGFHVGLYRATPYEPATDSLLNHLWECGAQVAVPVRDGAVYRWGGVTPDSRWQRGQFGIQEPLDSPRVDVRDLRIVVLPGVVFDRRGGRLGHGGGHFDRLLSQTSGLLVGLCMDVCLVEVVPLDAHDIAVDVVVTEKRVCFAPTAAAKLKQLTG